MRGIAPLFMNIKLMKTVSSFNSIDKKIESESLFEGCKLLESTNIINPTVILGGFSDIENVSQFNYCYIPKFKRYYFISDIKNMTGGRISIEMHVDVLKTYKASILDSQQLIIAENDKGKMYLSNREWVTDERTYTRCYNFDGDHFSTENDSFVLVCV